jgi:hypothetical protein
MRVAAACLASGLIMAPAWGKTRWSAVHMIPDADFIEGGQIVVDAEGFYFNDTTRKAAVSVPAAVATLGLIEWVNIEAGYAAGQPGGGGLLGFKARLLGETSQLMPSLAVGLRNILAHRESFFFKVKDDSNSMRNELYVVLGKTIEPIKTRFHLGMQTIPENKLEQFNPFFGIEWYFGAGVYSSIEVHRRHGEYVPSLFVTSRVFKKKLEMAAGVVALNHLLFDDGRFRFSLTAPSEKRSYVKQGVWFGVRYLGDLRFGGRGGFASVDDRMKSQEELLARIRTELDSLKDATRDTRARMTRMDQSLSDITDSMPTSKERMKAILLDKIITLKSLYATDPYEPEKAKQVIGEVVSFRTRAVPALKDILSDKSEDRYIRTNAASLLGEIGNKAAADVLLDALGSESDPQIRIETLIALGKMRETQAMYLMQQLANDPDEAVALTAQEVLLKLEKETGATITQDFRNRSAAPAVKNDPAAAARKADSSSAAAPPPTPPAETTIAAKPAPAALRNAPAAAPKAASANAGKTEKKASSKAATAKTPPPPMPGAGL